MEKLDEMKTLDQIGSICSLETNSQQYPQHKVPDLNSFYPQPQWQFYPNYPQANGTGGTMEIENTRPETGKEKMNNLNQHLNSNQRGPKNTSGYYHSPRGERRFIIPWKGKILTPTANELRKYEGNLNNIQANIGSREPNEKERSFKDIRIRWKGQTLKLTPRQLLQSKGILNELLNTPTTNKEAEFFHPNISTKKKVGKNSQIRGNPQ